MMGEGSIFFSDAGHRYDILRKNAVGNNILDVGGYQDIGPLFDTIKYSSLNKGSDLYPKRRPHTTYDGGKFPYPDDSFDTVSCVDTLEHMAPKDRPFVYSEMKRVGKKRILLLFPFSSPANNEFEKKLERTCQVLGVAKKPSLSEHLRWGLPKVQEIVGMMGTKATVKYHTAREVIEKYMLAQTYINSSIPDPVEIRSINQKLKEMMEKELDETPISEELAYRCLIILDLS